jgi:DNA-binding XRE family transcriptional regulator
MLTIAVRSSWHVKDDLHKNMLICHNPCMEDYVNMRTMGERISLWRCRAGLSQHELAKQAGIEVMTVARLERGTKKRLKGEPLAQLAKALSITTDYLLGIADEDDESGLLPAAVALIGA